MNNGLAKIMWIKMNNYWSEDSKNILEHKQLCISIINTKNKPAINIFADSKESRNKLSFNQNNQKIKMR